MMMITVIIESNKKNATHTVYVKQRIWQPNNYLIVFVPATHTYSRDDKGLLLVFFLTEETSHQ